MIDRPRSADFTQAPPLGGADVELGNFILGRGDGRQTCLEAARLVLSHVEGFEQVEPIRRDGDRSDQRDPQDWCRRFLAGNGGCVYIDLAHTEVCVPEVTGPVDYLTWWHAMLRIVEDARVRAQAALPAGETLEVMVNNSDGRGRSYGAHLNFLLARSTFERLLFRKAQLMALLASHQVSSIVYTGQGKVGAENGRPDVDYQIAQRADFFESLVGVQTTYRRPLVNLRDEAWCGAADRRYARLHVIFYDANLCHVACYLKFGVLQVVLSMLAVEALDDALILDDPLQALLDWSHDPDLRRRGTTIGGRKLTAVDHQLHIAEAARDFIERGDCPVPDAETIVDRWQRTLERLRRRDWDTLARDLDWVLKRRLLEGAMARRDDLTWSSPEIRMLDQLYGNLDPERGLYLACERNDAVTRLADDAAIDHAMTEPPSDTRAHARACLLRLAGPGQEAQATWDSVRFRLEGPAGVEYRTVLLDDPFEADLGVGLESCFSFLQGE